MAHPPFGRIPGGKPGIEASVHTCFKPRVLARAQRKEGGNVKSMTTSPDLSLAESLGTRLYVC